MLVMRNESILIFRQMSSTDADFDDSTAEAFFPDAHAIFSVNLKSPQEIRADCLVVLDTNALLVPYTINPKGLNEVERIYKDLVLKKRLFIPAQVAREFAKTRPIKLAELHQQLLVKKSKPMKFQQGKYPLLEALPEYAEVIAIEKKMDEQLSEYHEALSKVLNHIRNWCWNDPVSVLYGRLFSSEVVIEPKLSKEERQADAKKRRHYKIPPGYKDATKDDFGIGDVLIWQTILELGRIYGKSIIFVSTDEKADWFHQSQGAFYPRFELVNEYYRNSNAASFHILKLSDFLDLFEVGKQVVEDVRQEETRWSSEVSEDLLDEFSRYQLAEEAAIKWISKKYPGYRLSKHEDDCFDYIAERVGEAPFGIDVKIVEGPLQRFRSRQIVRDYSKRCEDEAFMAVDSFKNRMDVLLCLIAANEKAAMAVERGFEGMRRCEAGSKWVCIGWIDNTRSFVELCSFRWE